MTLLSWPVWGWCCSFIRSQCWTLSLEKQWKLKCGNEAGNHGGFQWETGSFLWYLHPECKLCCDLLVLKLVEKVLSSSMTGMCPGSPLQLQYNSALLGYVSEWLWKCLHLFLINVVWLRSSPLKQAITVCSLSFSGGFPMFWSSSSSLHPLQSLSILLSLLPAHFFPFFLFLSTKKTFSSFTSPDKA